MSNNEARMTFTEHLGELRTRIIRSGIALIVGCIICFAGFNYIFDALSYPLKPLEEKKIIAPSEEKDVSGEAGQPQKDQKQSRSFMVYLNPLEPFLVNMKVAMYGGFVVSLPFIIYQVCAFIFPGLKPNERKAILILLFGCCTLAIFGIAVAYFGVFPVVMPWLMTYAPAGVQIQLRMNETVNLILLGMLGFAVAFQFPMVVMVLVYMGLLSPDTLRRWRRPAIVGLAFVAAILTPPDPFSMIMMGVPLVLLYEASIWLSYLVVWSKKRKKSPAAAA